MQMGHTMVSGSVQTGYKQHQRVCTKFVPKSAYASCVNILCERGLTRDGRVECRSLSLAQFELYSSHPSDNSNSVEMLFPNLMCVCVCGYFSVFRLS